MTVDLRRNWSLYLC